MVSLEYSWSARDHDLSWSHYVSNHRHTCPRIDQSVQQIGDFDARVYHECLHLVAAHQGFKEQGETHVLLMQRLFQALAPLDSFADFHICLTQTRIAPRANAACIFPPFAQNVRDWETAPKGHLWHICHFRTFLRQRTRKDELQEGLELSLPSGPSKHYVRWKEEKSLSQRSVANRYCLYCFFFLSQDFMVDSSGTCTTPPRTGRRS